MNFSELKYKTFNFLKEDFKFSFIFKSFWVQKFVNILITKGKKKKAISIFMTILFQLKQKLGRNPIISLFEVFEICRPDVLAVRKKSGRLASARLILVPWWRQYKIVMFWFKKVFIKKNTSIGIVTRVLNEITSIYKGTSDSAVLQQKAKLYEIVADAKLKTHFRWRLGTIAKFAQPVTPMGRRLYSVYLQSNKRKLKISALKKSKIKAKKSK